MNKKVRIGYRMRQAVEYVSRHGGAAPSRLSVARAVGPHGSTAYGYRTVNRAIRAGLLTLDPDHPAASPHGAGAVVLGEQATGGSEEEGAMTGH